MWQNTALLVLDLLLTLLYEVEYSPEQTAKCRAESAGFCSSACSRSFDSSKPQASEATLATETSSCGYFC